MPYSHEHCSHPKTKVARAACRRERAGDKPDHTDKARVGGRLPSMIAAKLRPLIDAARDRGLVVKQVHDAPDGVAQAFMIHKKGKPDCQLIAESFRAARQGYEGKAEFYHIEGGQSRQLSRQRALDDLDRLAKA